MARPMDARLDRARRAIDREYAEGWTFRPMTRPAGPNGPTAADPGREVVDFVGIVTETPAVAFENKNVASFSPTASAGSVTTLSYVEDDTFTARAGDRVERRATGDLYALSEPRPSGRGRIAWRLAIVKT